jgi:tryptophan synthase alpha chain
MDRPIDYLSTMNRVDALFATARKAGKTAFIPFLTAGDPTLAISMAAAETLLEVGAELGVPVAVEIGFPYSDPIADGPTIQDSYNRALAGKIRIGDIFSALTELRSRRAEPLVAMISHSLVNRMGPKEFVETAVSVGLDAAIELAGPGLWRQALSAKLLR